MKRAIILTVLIITGVFTMSLWDKDKATDNRGIPTPQSKDENRARMAHGTQAFTLKQEDTDSTLGKLVFKDGKLSLIKEDGAVVNITGDGMKIAQPGYDAGTTTNANLVLSSGLNAFKIVSSGTASLTVANPMTAGSTVTATIAHSLGIAPAFLAYVTIPSDSSFFNDGQLTQLPTMLLDEVTNGSEVFIYVQARSDSSNLYLDIKNVSLTNQANLGTPWVFRYYILQETAN